MSQPVQPATAANHEFLQQYYNRHARVYDATRWLYLFGRSRLLKLLARGPAPAHVLEVGCGTGWNLVRLARCFPKAQFTGVDLSEPMLGRSRQRTAKEGARFRWVQEPYDRPLCPAQPFELVLFSYSLSMMNPGWDTAMQAATADLAPGGRIAVVDFHQTRQSWYRSWMWDHQVRMDGHLLPTLGKLFRPTLASAKSAYAGVWEYFLFLGVSEGTRSV